jgi:hypothetical protein
VLGTAGAATLSTSAVPAAASTLTTTLTLPLTATQPVLNSAVSSATDGLEFTLDAATLEQLRASGDGTTLVDPSAFGDAVAADDQTPMQVDGLFDDEDGSNNAWASSIVQLDGPADEIDETGAGDGLAEQEHELAQDEANVEGVEGVEQQILHQLHQDEAGTAESGEQHGFEEVLEAGEGAGGMVEEAFEGAAGALAVAQEGFSEHLEGGELSMEEAHPEGLDANDPAAAYIMQVSFLYCTKHQLNPD